MGSSPCLSTTYFPSALRLVSDGMLDKYRATAATLGLPKSRMMAVQGNLLAPMVQPTNPPLDDEELDGFDLVAICMALHHVEDIQLATQRLASRLRPGGHASPDAVHPKHPAAHIISNDSFTQEQIVNLYEQAGCGDMSGKMQLFWVRATKL
ncbi:hypothetical protein BDV33DRAFT_232552 [Aspergillus novoparasiticus]|uniref:Methyltransferase type 11 domain-containing protein n=1 Tax=Aspergillus novoparasiticus TaxID=986946 RepID=A0A5N6EN52_9EURO|nr:hypothetical protein BDV33DRAFT_232552 [Aspergillus novoparasiticus]